MVDPVKAGGLALGLVVAGVLVVGIGLGGGKILSRSVKVDDAASPPTPGQVSRTQIPALDAEVPGDIATATFALG